MNEPVYEWNVLIRYEDGSFQSLGLMRTEREAQEEYRELIARERPPDRPRVTIVLRRRPIAAWETVEEKDLESAEGP